METDSLHARLFEYPRFVHQRRHGPRGYADSSYYKPWLRDEFQFRCVYCLCRERWFPDGDVAFGVDHLEAQSVAAGRVCDYDNLLYACLHCNSAKRDVSDIPDPCVEPYGNHLDVSAEGAIRGLTILGLELIKICQLDRPKLTEYRRRMIQLAQALEAGHVAAAVGLRHKYFGYPDNLPRLTLLRPPGGNLRSAGIDDSHFHRKKRGELPETY